MEEMEKWVGQGSGGRGGAREGEGMMSVGDERK